MAGKRGPRSWGRIRQRKSGRYQAGYIGPDGILYWAPTTYTAKIDAEGWLSGERRLVEGGNWTPPDRRSAAQVARGLTVAAYASRWLTEAENRLKPRTVVLYRGYLDNLVVPALGESSLAALTASDVRAWRAALDPQFPTRNANAYGLLRTILAQAVDDEILPANPARIRGGSVKHRVHEPIALRADEIRALADAMPPRWAAVVLLAGFGGLRIGEVQALQRKDLVLTEAETSVTVRRAAVRVGGEWLVDRPKSRAALRTVPLPPGLRPVLTDHLEAFSEPGPGGLVITAASGAGIVHRDSMSSPFSRAAKVIGHVDLRIHDLRHSCATNLGNAGATLADLMMMMGWTSAAMAARYTHTTASRNAALAAKVWE